MLKKISINILGTLLMGFGISLLIVLNKGVDTISILYMGVQNQMDIELWILCLIINLILVVLVLLINKKLIGIGTIINFLGISLCLKLFPDLLATYLLPYLNDYLAYGFVLFGVIILAIGCGYYAKADLGSAALEALSTALSLKSGLDFKYMRILLDGITVLLGLLMGASIGVGTILCVLLIGPISKKVQF